MEDKSDTEVKNEKDDKQGCVASKEELQNIEKDVLEIEKDILNEASNIVSISTSSTTDQTMFLQPFDDLEKETGDELLDEAAKIIELLTYDDGQELEHELEQSALCLEQIMPRTQSEVELDDSEEESESENRDDVVSEESFARFDVDNLVIKRGNLVNFSGGSTDSELDLNFGVSNKNKLKMKPERGENPENTDSEIPLTDSDLAFTDSDVMNTDSEVATADVEVISSELPVKSPEECEVNNANESMESPDINIACLNIGNTQEGSETEQSEADLGSSNNTKALWEESEIDIEIINIDSSELSSFVSESSGPISHNTDLNIKFENLTKAAGSAEFVESPVGDPGKGGEATFGDSQASYCRTQASSCISELSLSPSGATQLQLQDISEHRIDQKESSSESLDEFVQLGHSESSGAGNSHKHRKCPDILTLDDEVEIVGKFSVDEQENIMQQDEADKTLVDQKTSVERLDEMLPEEKVEECLDICCDLIVESKEMIDGSSVVVDNTVDDQEEVMNSAISKEIINGYLYPDVEVAKDESADEGWGDDILLEDLEMTGDNNPNLEDDIDEQVDIGQSGELQDWLEKKEKEFDMIMGSDQEPPEKHCIDDDIQIKENDLDNELSGPSEDPIVEEPEKCEVEEVNLQAEILKQLTEKILFASSDDLALESNDGEDKHAKPLEIIDEQMVFNQTEDQILVSNSLLITPMVVTPKVKRKKSSKTPKNPRKNIKSPLLRRKEIRTCISLHNACETSDVLQELMRPAVSYGSNLNLVEAVENTPENLALEEIKSTTVDQPKLKKVKKSSLAGKMSNPGMPWFPWKTLSFLLLISTAAIINLDCQKHGNFSKSSTGQFLRDIGQYDRVLTGYQVVVDRSKEGKQWVDTNVPVYAEHARRVGGPYYEVAQTKAGEAWALMVLGYGKLELAVKAGVVTIEGWVPGAQEQINRVGQAVVKGGQVMWLRTQQGALTLQQGAVDLVNGDVDWVAVKANAVARAQIVQGQLVAAFNYVQGQVNQLVK